MNTKNILKTILWALVGVLAVITVVRFLRGFGVTTSLSDATPWGFWIPFKIATVAMSAGGFVLAAVVYIFGREKYHVFARPAILTAFLGYTSFAVGLIYDLGLPWHIWYPAIYPQHHSALFEVAMCVMLYLTVLLLEFAPTIMEHPWFDRPSLRKIHGLLKKITIPLVITGIVLSTLHQSSLGSLFLIAPHRAHPLWYSPIVWILFLVSAVGLGIMMVIAESFFSSWLLSRKLRMDLLSNLAKAASVVLFVYAGLRLGDMAIRGALASAFDGSWQAYVFLLEISLSALIPATILMLRRVRASSAGLTVCAVMTAIGIIGYRFNICLVAFTRPDEMPYFPSWMEIAVSFGIIAGAMLIFIFFVENLKVYPEEKREKKKDALGSLARQADYAPISIRNLSPDSVKAPRRYSLAFVVAVALSIAFLPADVWLEEQTPKTPVFAARALDGWALKLSGAPGGKFSVVKPILPPGVEARPVELLIIDGNRDGRAAIFPHNHHIEKLGDRDSCKKCHHQRMPFDKNTSCYECHRDEYSITDIFDHSFHIKKLRDNDSCVHCHKNTNDIKTRDTAMSCSECHSDTTAVNYLIHSPEVDSKGFAVGYMDAMHGMCTSCHEQKMKENIRKYGSNFAQCSNCHRDTPTGSSLRPATM